MLQALINLRALPAWREVDKLLSAELAATTDKLIQCHDEVAVRKLQGRAQTLRDILETVAKADVAILTAKP